MGGISVSGRVRALGLRHRKVLGWLGSALVIALGLGASYWFVVLPARVAGALASARTETRGARALEVTRGPAHRLAAPPPPGVQVFTATGEATDGLAAFGRLWVATTGGVLIFDEGGAHERTLTWLDGLATADATAMIRWGRYVVVGGGDGSLTLIDSVGDTAQALRFTSASGRTAAVAALAASDERLLVGTLGAGLIAWDGARATVVTLADGTPLPDAITALAVADDGRLAVGAGDGQVFVARDGLLVAFGPDGAAAHGRVTALAWNGDALLVGRPFGLDRIEPDGRVRAIAADVFVTALLVDAAAGRTWIGTFDAGVRSLEGSERVGHAGRIAALRLIGGRPVAFGAAGALDVAAGGRPRVAWPASPLPGAHVTALAAREGEIVAGTFAHGLARFDTNGGVRGRLVTGDAYGLAQINHADARAERGDLLVSTARGALLLDARGGTRRVLPRDGLAGDQIAATATRGARVAYATNRGVTVFSEGSAVAARTLNASFGLANHHATAVAWDAEERLWVGTLGGLSIVTPALVVDRNVGAGPTALGAAWVTALVLAPGGMYVGTYGGGVALVTPVGKVDRLDGPWGRRPVRVNPGAMIVHEGRVLVGTLDDGLLVYDVATRRWSTAHAPLGSRNVTAILWTEGALWIGTAEGLVRIARAEEVLS